MGPPAVGDHLDDLGAVGPHRIGVQLSEPLAVLGPGELQAVEVTGVLEVQSVRRPEPLVERLVFLDGQQMEDSAAIVVDADNGRVEVEPVDRARRV